MLFSSTLSMRTESVPENLERFYTSKWLSAREDFITLWRRDISSRHKTCSKMHGRVTKHISSEGL